MASDEDILKEARNALEEGNREVGAKLFLAAASRLATKMEYEKAAKIYEEGALIYRDVYEADECFKALDNATLMLIRLPQGPEVYKEIVRINKTAAKIAEEATEYKKAADYYLRAQDFAVDEKEKVELSIKTADALEGNIAGFGENTVIVTPSFAKIHKEVHVHKEEKRSKFD